jgi:hypothetical protein
MPVSRDIAVLQAARQVNAAFCVAGGEMSRSRWLFPWGAVILASLAVGIGIGLALPHLWQHRAGSTLFRQLVDDTRPGDGDFRQGVLAARLREKFSGVQVIRSKPAWSGDITQHIRQAFSIVIMTPRLSLPQTKVDSKVLLDELERYLKGIASAALFEGVKTKTENVNGKNTDWMRFGETETNTSYSVTDSKKNGFWFGYRVHEGDYGEVSVYLINDVHVAAMMDVLE